MTSNLRFQRALRRFTRRLGFEFVSYPGGKEHWRQLVGLLADREIDTVLDVGANNGQYAAALRRAGYAQRIVSFEPLSAAHEQLSKAAAHDTQWQIAPRMALGETHGDITINVSNESDMSSILPMRAETAEMLDSSRFIGTEPVPLRTLAEVWPEYAGDRGAFVKIDTQGYEDQVLDGLGEHMEAVSGLQLELSLTPMYDGETPYRQMLDRLADHQLVPHLVIPGYYCRHHRRMVQFDAVFFRETSPPQAI